MGLFFEWDNRKAKANERKHGISFEEAATAFRDPLSLTILDQSHSQVEERFITIGKAINGRLLVVVHAIVDDSIRIISARSATGREGKDYEEGTTSPA